MRRPQKIYKCTILIQSSVKLEDTDLEVFLESSRFNSMTAAIAIAVNNFNRQNDQIVAKVADA